MNRSVGSSDGDDVADLTLARNEKKFEPQDSDKPDTDDDGEGLDASAESDLPQGVPKGKDLTMVTREFDLKPVTVYQFALKTRRTFKHSHWNINGSREAFLEPNLS